MPKTPLMGKQDTDARPSGEDDSIRNQVSDPVIASEQHCESGTTYRLDDGRLFCAGGCGVVEDAA
jgi:hypothetical protein